MLLDTGARPDGSDHVYLADFGITKRVSEETGIGDDGQLLGTIDYVAPEQIAGDSGVALVGLDDLELAELLAHPTTVAVYHAAALGRMVTLIPRGSGEVHP